MRSTSADPESSSGTAEDARLEHWAAYTPLVIIVYFALQLAVRLWLSPNLEVDDAELVGQIHWAWGYANSHPPLYHWVVRLAHDLTGNWVAATSLPKFALLAAGYWFIYDAGRRATGRRLTGALAAASLLFIPVIAWKTQGKLTHSIVGFTATAATLHAVVLILTRGRWWTFAWLGVAAACGILAKYNYVLVLVALALTVVAVRELRRAFRRPVALLAMLVALVLIAPHLVWISANAALATERVYMLQTGGGPLGLNLPANSAVDGLVSLVLVVLVSVAPVAAVWGLAHFIARRRGASNADAGYFRRVVGVLLVAEVAVFGALVAIGGFAQVHERYLVVLLPPVTLWFALRFQKTRSAAVVLGTAVTVATAITIARPVTVLQGTGRLMFPYEQMSKEIAAFAARPVAILGDRPENAANLVIRLPKTSVFDPRAPADRVIAVADTPARAAEIAQRLSRNYVPDSEVRAITAPFPSRPGRQAELAVQSWRRVNAD